MEYLYWTQHRLLDLLTWIACAGMLALALGVVLVRKLK